jgi:hypothetical protein
MLYTIREPEYRIIAEETEAACQVCGSMYWIQASKAAGSRYCSRACQGVARSMNNGGPPSKELLTHLYYNEKLSMLRIARRLRCSSGKVGYWMNQYGLERRDWSEASYVDNNPNGDPFSIMIPDTLEGRDLFGLGLGLYMGEGDKRDPKRVALSNSNPGILKIFIRFLEEICGVRRSDLSCQLHLYPDLNAETLIVWWSEQLQIDQKQFLKPFVHEGKPGTYRRKSDYGTLQVAFYNTKLKAFILEWCRLEYERHT